MYSKPHWQGLNHLMSIRLFNSILIIVENQHFWCDIVIILNKHENIQESFDLNKQKKKQTTNQ